MIALALGLIQLFRYGSSLPLSIILTLAAISFVLSASFFERYEVGSIMWSMLVSLIATLMLTLLSGGIIYGITTQRQSWEELLSGLAICMIVGMTMLSYLKRSLGEIEY
jgi:heme/copper-type cytochrome/quinol oxidase subunit 4